MTHIYTRLLIGSLLFISFSTSSADTEITITADNYAFRIPEQWVPGNIGVKTEMLWL